jgi:hypothetical protein
MPSRIFPMPTPRRTSWLEVGALVPDPAATANTSTIETTTSVGLGIVRRDDSSAAV